MRTSEWNNLLPEWLGTALPLGVFATDAELVVRYWSPWLAEQSRLAAAQAHGAPLATLFPDLTARKLEGHFARALRGETVVLRQREHGYLLPLPAPPNKAGLTHMQQRAVIAPLVIDGSAVGLLGVISDMTERVAQDVLLAQTISQQEETLALLDTLITKAPIGFAFVDTELRYRGINECLAEFNGVPIAEHLGQTIAEIVPGLAAQQGPLCRAVIDSGEPLTDVELKGETRARPGATRVWQASYYPVRTADRKSLGVGMLVTEITERARGEERERFMARLSSAMTASLDYQTTLDALARAVVPYLADWCSIFISEELAGQPFSAVAHTDDEAESMARKLQALLPPSLGPDRPLRRVLTEGRPQLMATVSDADLVARAPDGPSLSLLRALRPTSNMLIPLVVGGEGIGVLALTRCGASSPYDEDDLALAEEVARRAVVALENARLFAVAERSRATAEEAVRVRDAFFSIAAHELRTPLTTLLGRSQLLQKWLEQSDGADQRSTRSIGIIVDQARRLNRMITALLDVSRIQGGRFSIEPAPMELGSLVRRVAEETRTTLSAHTIALDERVAELAILGDEVRLEQVLQNLLSNAVKYSPAGGEIRLVLDRAGDEARLTVSDSGIGIPAVDRDQLFRRFYRAANAEGLGISGLGIGLFVVSQIVELHGGTIGVVSEEGAGSSFTVGLPLAPGPAPQAAAYDS